MGLTWILGLAANWKQTEFLHYPSTVLNCMQGTFSSLICEVPRQTYVRRCVRACPYYPIKISQKIKWLLQIFLAVAHIIVIRTKSRDSVIKFCYA